MNNSSCNEQQHGLDKALQLGMQSPQCTCNRIHLCDLTIDQVINLGAELQRLADKFKGAK